MKETIPNWVMDQGERGDKWAKDQYLFGLKKEITAAQIFYIVKMKPDLASDEEVERKFREQLPYLADVKHWENIAEVINSFFKGKD